MFCTPLITVPEGANPGGHSESRINHANTNGIAAYGQDVFDISRVAVRFCALMRMMFREEDGETYPIVGWGMNLH